MAPKHLHLFLRISLFFFPFLSLSLWLDWLSCTQPSDACEPVRKDRLPYSRARTHTHTHTHTHTDTHTHSLTESCTGANSHPPIHTHTPHLTHTHTHTHTQVSSRCLTHHWIWKDVYGVMSILWVFVLFWEYYEVAVLFESILLAVIWNVLLLFSALPLSVRMLV